MTEEIINCDFYNDKICNLFTEYFKFKVECKNLSLCTVDDDTEKECPYKQLKRLEQENKELKKQIESDKGLITVGGKQQYEYLQRIDELKKTVENQKLEYEELQCDLSEVENACGCYQSENAELKQENKELKSDVLKWQKAFSRQYQINENKGYSKAEENYRSALEEIREIAEKYKDMEGCRIPLGAIKMTVDEVLNEKEL